MEGPPRDDPDEQQAGTQDPNKGSRQAEISEDIKQMSSDIRERLGSLQQQLYDFQSVLPLILAEGLLKVAEQQNSLFGQLLAEQFQHHGRLMTSQLELRFQGLRSHLAGAPLGPTEISMDFASGQHTETVAAPDGVQLVTPDKVPLITPDEVPDGPEVHEALKASLASFQQSVLNAIETKVESPTEIRAPNLKRKSEKRQKDEETPFLTHEFDEEHTPGGLGAPNEGNLLDEAYSVENLYRTTGLPQAIARNENFLNFVLFVIVLNAIYIGVAADVNKEDSLYDAHWAFIILDNFFCTFFTCELLIRFLAFARKSDTMHDKWFCFDSAMLLMMILETWVVAPIQKVMESSRIPIPVEPLRLIRLLRLTRLARLMRNVPELVTMTTGLVAGARACGASIVMILILMYIFAIALHSFLKDEDVLNADLSFRYNLHFKSLGDCMWLLMVDGVFMLDNTGNVMTVLLRDGRFSTVMSCLIILTFIFLAAMVVCNMLVGVLCEVVAQVAQRERDDKAIMLLKETMLEHLKGFDDGDGMISKEELDQVMVTPGSKALLHTLNVDRVFMMALQKLFYTKHTKQIPIKTVMELMLACRGDTPATVHTIAINLSYLGLRLDEVQQTLSRQLKKRFPKSIGLPGQTLC